jgi:uncharacterized repeat protein (TIGR02543 family)
LIRDKPEYSGKIQERCFAGAAIPNDGSENVAGAEVPNQGLWPLSVTEAKTLSNQALIFGFYWWLRSPGTAGNDHVAYISDDHLIYTSGDNGMDVHSRLAARPALYLNLSSSIFTSLNNNDPNWQDKVASTYSGTEGGNVIPPGTEKLTGNVTGKVTDEAGTPIASANIIIQKGRLQHSTTTDAQGNYTFTGLAVGTWNATVSAAGSYFTQNAQITVAAGVDAVLNISLRKPQPLPVINGVSLANGTHNVTTNADGVPQLYWNQPITIDINNPAYKSGKLSWQFTLNGKVVASDTGIADSPAGSGHFVATINPQGSWPTGQGTISYSISLPSKAVPVSGSFDVYYIDPSGVVVDKYGTPIKGAKVTLLQKNTKGEFVAVPNGSPDMAPSNRTNPSTTGADGTFHWDVIDGTYKVVATYKGKSTTTAAMQISPARTGLVIKLDVAFGKAPVPVTYPKVAGTLKAGKTLKLSGIKWASDIKQKSYDWYVGGKLQKTHKAQLKLTKAMLNKKIECYAVAERTVLGNPDGIAQDNGQKQQHKFAIKAKVYPLTVSFDTNGGKALAKSKAVKANLKVGAKAGALPKTTRVGYTFKGWYTKATGGTKLSAATKAQRTLTYYANWKIKSGYVQASFDTNGGTVLAAAKATKAVKKSAKLGTLPKPVRDGYKFLGWYSAKFGGKKITTATKLAKKATYYAHWQMQL